MRLPCVRILARYITGKGLKITGIGLILLYAAVAGLGNQESSKIVFIFLLTDKYYFYFRIKNEKSVYMYRI